MIDENNYTRDIDGFRSFIYDIALYFLDSGEFVWSFERKMFLESILDLNNNQSNNNELIMSEIICGFSEVAFELEDMPMDTDPCFDGDDGDGDDDGDETWNNSWAHNMAYQTVLDFYGSIQN